MSKDKNHSEEFERYLKGEMTPTEAHAFEREVLNDPFAIEALEGLEMISPSQVSEDIAKLKGKVQKQQKAAYPWLRIAAAVSFILISSFLVFYATDSINQSEISMENELEETPSFTDTIKTPISKEEKNEIAQVIEQTAKDELEKDGVSVATEDEEIVETYTYEKASQSENSKPNVIAELEFTEAIESLEVLENKTEALQLAEAPQIDKMQIDSILTIDDSSNMRQSLASVESTKKVSLARSAFVDEPPPKIDPKSLSNKARVSERDEKDFVTGTITDDAGEPLPGVNVLIKGTTTGVTSDLDGHYELPKSANMMLVYSFVGFETQEQTVGSRTTVDVTMGGATELQEVVVTAQATERSNKAFGNNIPAENGFSPASPKDGLRAYKKYLEENLRYPEAASANEIEGTVILELQIDPSGKINDINIKKSLGYGCDEEAIRLVQEGPSWVAAERGDSKVEDKVKVRVKFKVDD